MGYAPLPLLESLSESTGCLYLSELKFLPPAGRKRLESLVENIPEDAAPLAEWNEALRYLTGTPAADTAGQARALLLQALK